MRALAALNPPSSHTGETAASPAKYPLLLAPVLWGVLTYEGVLLEPWLEAVCFQFLTLVIGALIPTSFHMPSIF